MIGELEANNDDVSEEVPEVDLRQEAVPQSS